jgi:ubiquinone/menaquinone biosynthesis C-methylase UbiE
MVSFVQTLKQFVSPGGIEGYFATMYAECAKNSEMMRDDYRKLAAAAASAIQSGRVLEVGPGPGYVSIETARLLPEVEVVGLDISETMVEIATQNAAEYGVLEQVAFRQGDASNMPFEDSSFDFVISCGSLHHWKEPTRIFREIHRVLRPGCCALVDDLRRDVPKECIEEWVSAHKSRFMRWGARHSFSEAYTPQEIKDLLEGSGFETFDVKVGEWDMEIWLRKQHSTTGGMK